MKSALRLASAAAAVLVSLGAARGADFHDHLGLQLYSLRAQIKIDPLHALDLARSYGIREVETAGTIGNLSPQQFRAALTQRGLDPVSAHVSYERLQKELPAVIAEVKALGAEFAICPWIPHQGDFDAPTMQQACMDFNRWGAAFRAAGLRFGYHPHGYEFVPAGRAGDTLFDHMVRATNPDDVCFELDVFWAVHGGADPVALLKKYPDRWVALHIKDIRKGAPTGIQTGHAPATDNVAIGKGQIDWRAVLSAAEEIGVKYYFIEDETPTPLQCIPESFEYLRGLKL